MVIVPTGIDANGVRLASRWSGDAGIRAAAGHRSGNRPCHRRSPPAWTLTPPLPCF